MERLALHFRLQDILTWERNFYDTKTDDIAGHSNIAMLFRGHCPNCHLPTAARTQPQPASADPAFIHAHAPRPCGVVAYGESAAIES